MNRRQFLASPALAAAAAQAPNPPAPPDSVTNPPGLEYFFLGNGRIAAAIQYSQLPEAGTQAGVVLMSPEHLNRKSGTLLWHHRAGLQYSRLTVVVNGTPFSPIPGSAEMSWHYPDSIPTVRIQWSVGPCLVTEHLSCPSSEPALLRTVEIKNTSSAPATVQLRATLRPNPLLFDEFDADPPNSRVVATGYHHLALTSVPKPALVDRDIEVALAPLAPGSGSTATFVLTLDQPAAVWDAPTLARARAATTASWRNHATLSSGHDGLDHIFRASAHGLRAVVAASGKMDGGPWGYCLEWVRDSCMAACGAALAGLPDLSAAILHRTITRNISENGAAVDSSIRRPPETIELDQNGQLLHTLYTHWVWTGDDSILRRHWPRIRATADFPLQPVFRDPQVGLVKNSREFWERSVSYGVLEGYELAAQVWNIEGWQRAAQIATHLGDSASANRWLEASRLMRESFLSHPRFSFVRDGRFTKRILASGAPQLTFTPPNREALPPGMPLRTESVSYCDPDSANVLPILFGIVDPSSGIARRTLESIETLWNQRWDIGGYGRYHVTSEPDSPGPWPFASLFIARAYLEAGDSAKVWRVLEWLASVPGGRTGTWFEYYGPRPIPPLPPVAIIPWTWAEILTLTVHHLLGVRPDPQGVTIRPRLLDGLDHITARLRLNGHNLHLTLRRGSAPPTRLPLRIPRPTQDTTIEVNL